MKNLLFIALVVIVAAGCCRKKYCPGDDLPRIPVKLTGVGETRERVKIYELLNGARRDTISFYDSEFRSFSLLPFNDFDDATVPFKQYVILHNGKYDTIRNISGSFVRKLIKCDNGWGCGRSQHDGETIMKLENFSLQCRGNLYHRGDTLFLD